MCSTCMCAARAMCAARGVRAVRTARLFFGRRFWKQCLRTFASLEYFFLENPVYFHLALGLLELKQNTKNIE